MVGTEGARTGKNGQETNRNTLQIKNEMFDFEFICNCKIGKDFSVCCKKGMEKNGISIDGRHISRNNS